METTMIQFGELAAMQRREALREAKALSLTHLAEKALPGHATAGRVAHALRSMLGLLFGLAFRKPSGTRRICSLLRRRQVRTLPPVCFTPAGRGRSPLSGEL
jgi:hypothetical protein